MSQCPCGSGKDYDVCCGPLIAGTQAAATAEGLMRSRYAAYAKGAVDYLSNSLHPEQRHDYDPVATQRWAESSDWLGLNIVNVSKGGKEDDEGTVEFIATYREKGLTKSHHERGSFRRLDGAWYYVEGKLVPPETQRHEGPKVGRNDPCPCGSGKKFKKCCG